MPVGVFDLGGVLYDFAGRSVLERYTTEHKNDLQLKMWSTLPFVQDFETGKESRESFAEKVVDYYKLNLSPNSFLYHFEQAAKGFYPGALDLVRSANFSVKVTLSNTNELHWPKVVQDLGTVDPFNRHFPSHKTGHHKPALPAYERVLSEFPNEKLVFFDDNECNVDAARAVGFTAFLVKGIEELRPFLQYK